MEDKLRRLEEENARLHEAIERISEHVREIDHIIKSLSVSDDDDAAQFTDDDVKSLLKKYSRL